MVYISLAISKACLKESTPDYAVSASVHIKLVMKAMKRTMRKAVIELDIDLDNTQARW